MVCAIRRDRPLEPSWSRFVAQKELIEALKTQGAVALAEFRAKRPKEQMDLSGAILPEAQLANAVLSDANLTGTYLRQANLRGADLRLAVLNGTNLEGADLAGAVLGRTTFANVDFNKILGLDKLVFEAPCEIGLHSIFGVENPVIRRALLRGAGYVESIVEKLVAINENPKAARTAFVAYLRRDGFHARAIAQRLEAEGIRTWPFVIDQPGRLSGFREILTHIRAEDWVVFLASEAAMQNDYVDKVIEKVIQARKLQPVALDRYLSTEWEHAMRNDMMQLRIVPLYDCDTEDKKEAAMHKLIAALRRGVMEHL
jgi:hypothetical protein